MFIWLTGLVVFVVFFGLFLWTEGWCGETVGIPIRLGVVCLLLAFLASIIVSFCVPSTAVSEVGRSEIQLIALKDNMAVDGYHGGRYVYRGYIDEMAKMPPEALKCWLDFEAHTVRELVNMSLRCGLDKGFSEIKKTYDQLVKEEPNVPSKVLFEKAKQIFKRYFFCF